MLVMLTMMNLKNNNNNNFFGCYNVLPVLLAKIVFQNYCKSMSTALASIFVTILCKNLL